MKTKSALSYFGSDSEVAGELAGLLNHCRHVTIAFCGGMSLLPWLPARAVVANDLNDLAINFYRHATSPVHQHDLFERCQRTLSHPSELELALTELGEENQWTRVQAWAYWAMCWIGRKGKGGSKILALPASLPIARCSTSELPSRNRNTPSGSKA